MTFSANECGSWWGKCVYSVFTLLQCYNDIFFAMPCYFFFSPFLSTDCIKNAMHITCNVYKCVYCAYRFLIWDLFARSVSSSFLCFVEKLCMFLCTTGSECCKPHIQNERAKRMSLHVVLPKCENEKCALLSQTKIYTLIAFSISSASSTSLSCLVFLP